jgi:hypothetical protein
MKSYRTSLLGTVKVLHSPTALVPKPVVPQYLRDRASP